MSWKQSSKAMPSDPSANPVIAKIDEPSGWPECPRQRQLRRIEWQPHRPQRQLYRIRVLDRSRMAAESEQHRYAVGGLHR